MNGEKGKIQYFCSSELESIVKALILCKSFTEYYDENKTLDGVITDLSEGLEEEYGLLKRIKELSNMFDKIAKG